MYFKTIATLDLETTSFAFPKITEICVLACERDHCEEYNKIPRVLHKLSICINPNSKIHPGVTSITGLDNEDLANVSFFDERVAEMLDNFLSRLPKPICLVAHNGLKFDFPLLVKELTNCGPVNLDYVFCADSLIAFRQMFSKNNATFKEFISSVNDESCLEAVVAHEGGNTMKDVNEKTPDRPTEPLLMAPKKKTKHCSRPIDCSARRKLNFSDLEESLTEVVQEKSPRCPTGPIKVHLNCRGFPKSFKLGDVYEFLHGYRFDDAHRAESDAHALLECMVKCTAIFKWIDVNAVPFNAISSR